MGRKGDPSACPVGPAHPADPMAGLLERAAWAQADVHLARAWREARRLEGDLGAAAASAVRRDQQNRARRPSALTRRLVEAADRAVVLRQDLDRAAAQRRLERSEEAFARFEPNRHVALSPPRRGARVRILAPAIVRRATEGEELLVRADVEAAPAKRPRRKAGS